jgi:hypothetical protein
VSSWSCIWHVVVSGAVGQDAGGCDPLTAWTALYAIAATATFAIVAVGVVLAIRQLNETVRSRHAALMSEFSKRWDEPRLVESRAMIQKYTPARLLLRVQALEGTMGSLNELQDLLRVPNFLEDLAVLEREGAISFEMIRLSLGGEYVQWWDHWKPTTAYMRGDETYDLVFENMEGLAERLRADIARHNRGRPPSSAP